MNRPQPVSLAAWALIGLCLGVLHASPADDQAGLQGLSHWANPAPSAPAQFGRTATGDFDADGLLDLVSLRGDRLEVLLGPGLYDVHLELPGSVRGFGVYRSKDAEPRHKILASTPQGLVELCLDVPSSTWTTQVIAASWSDARLLQVHDMGTTVGVVGVKPDGKSVAFLFLVGGVWSEQHLVTLPKPVVDLTLLQFNGLGQVEIAVALPDALVVFDLAGKVCWYWKPPDVASVTLARLEQADSAFDWLAWIATRSNGRQDLLVASSLGTLPVLTLSQLPFIVDMRAGDLDNDGNSDLVLSHTQMHAAAVLLDIGDGLTPQFTNTSPEAYHLLPIGPPNQTAPDNKTRPALTDVDGDGDNDLLMPVQSSGEIFLWRNGHCDENALEPGVQLDPPEQAANLIALPSGELALELQLTLDLPPEAGATHLELIAWRRASPGVPTEVVAVDRVLVALPGSGPQQLQATLTLPQPPDLVPGSNVRCEGMYLWVQRAVRIENGALVHSLPARAYAIETSPSPENYSWIKSLGGKMMFPIHEQQNGTTLPDLIGCGSEMPCLPDFPGGQVPTWN